MSHAQPGRSADFLREYKRATLKFTLEERTAELDRRIRIAGLTLAEKIDVFKQLAPRLDPTDPSKELRMERLLLSVSPEDLAQFKFALEYDGDYKDVAEYVFHDIDDKPRQ